mgnify:CR=1 FL=1
MIEKKHYNEKGIQEFLRASNLKSNTLEGALEEIRLESDEVAARLSPDIQKELVKIYSDKWYGRLTCMGMTAVAASVAYLCFKGSNPPDYNEAVAMVSAVPFNIGCMLTGAYLDSRRGNKIMKKLRENFPDKATDIDRMRKLKAMYTTLEIASLPPIG